MAGSTTIISPDFSVLTALGEIDLQLVFNLDAESLREENVCETAVYDEHTLNDRKEDSQPSTRQVVAAIETQSPSRSDPCRMAYIDTSTLGAVAPEANHPHNTSLLSSRLESRAPPSFIHIPNEQPPATSPQPIYVENKNTRKRKGYQQSSGYKAKRAKLRHDKSQDRLETKIASTSSTAVARVSYANLPKSTNGISGSRMKSVQDRVDWLCKDLAYRMAELRSYRLVPYQPRSILHVYDRDKVLVGLRTFRHHAMDAAYMTTLVREVDKLATLCNVREGVTPHKRGNFAQMRVGWNHGIGEANNFPYRLKEHKLFQTEVEQFLESEPVKLAIRVGNELFVKYFPKAARFYKDLNTFWQSKTEGRTSMEFGHFYTMAINFAMDHEVKAIPHIDTMNFAPAPCAIFAFGFFPSDVSAWFVNHSAGVVVQIPTGVWNFALSALQIHSNEDPQSFIFGGIQGRLVTTSDYQWPTEKNTTPLNAIGSGRGSLVLYNQASFAHWFITGEQYISKASATAAEKERLKELFISKALDILEYQS